MTQKDSEKLKILYELYEQPMYRIAFAVLHSSPLAEDAVSDAFVTVIRHLHKFKNPESDKAKAYIGNNSPQDCINGYLRTSHDGYLCECDRIPDNDEQADFFKFSKDSIGNINGLFSFSSPNKVGFADHIGLGEGEETDLKTVFLINEKLIGNLYLDVVNMGSDDPIFDLCDIK